LKNHNNFLKEEIWRACTTWLEDLLWRCSNQCSVLLA
jgi:hypothetical protein